MLPRHTARQPPPMLVERTVTTPMSRQQREQAVTALAVLITAWQHSHAAEPDQDDGPLPLPGPGERH